jgi:hypothetical protein
MKLKTLFDTIIITLIFCAVWSWLEQAIYGAVEPRIVDDIMILFMAHFFYIAADRFADKKRKLAKDD